MGEAKRRRDAPPMVYHHTSVLRTNLLWMAGEIRPEGATSDITVPHPHLPHGVRCPPANYRRALVDFPPVVWFTTRVDVPGCMRVIRAVITDKDGNTREEDLDRATADAFTWKRVALGFRVADVPVVPWPEYYGYNTGEGRELNETATDAGDDPREWYVSEKPVDLMAMAEIRLASSVLQPKLERSDWYLAQVQRMVAGCRATPGVYIPPSWLPMDQARRLAAAAGVPSVDADEL